MLTFKPETRSPDWNIGLTFYNCIFVESCIYDKGLWNSHDMIGVSGGFTHSSQMLRYCEILLGTVPITQIKRDMFQE